MSTEAEGAPSDMKKILESLYLDGWTAGREAEREQNGIRTAVPDIEKALQRLEAHESRVIAEAQSRGFSLAEESYKGQLDNWFVKHPDDSLLHFMELHVSSSVYDKRLARLSKERGRR